MGKIFLSATHTHTAPVLENDSILIQYAIPEKECSKRMNTFAFLSSMSDGIIKAGTAGTG